MTNDSMIHYIHSTDTKLLNSNTADISLHKFSLINYVEI